eukprot:gene187-70_t
MFGPDQCGGTKRTHLIFNYKDKNHLRRDDISWADHQNPALFTLIIKPDNSYAVRGFCGRCKSGAETCGYEFMVKLPFPLFSEQGAQLCKRYSQELGSTPEQCVVSVRYTDIVAQLYYEGVATSARVSNPEVTAVLPAKKIKDPAVSKPSDWVDEEEMQDPEAKKPEDWVEEKRIKDPKAEKPEDWEHEEDGEWEAPMIDNPDFKGE